MGASSKIEWTDATWNPIRARLKGPYARQEGSFRWGYHCERISPGCKNCYASTMNGRMLPSWGTGLNYTVPNREKVEIFLDEEELIRPLHWKKPRKIFPCSMTDWCADFVTDEMRDRMMAIAALCPQHTFLFLSKRSDVNARYLNDERRSGFVTGEIRRIADSRQWRSVADAEKARQRSNARRGILQGVGDHTLLQSSGVQEHFRISPDPDDDKRKGDNRGGTQVSVGILSRPNSGRPDDQSPQRSEGRQPDRESRIGDNVGTEDTCAFRSECEQEQAERIKASEDPSCGIGCSSDEGKAQSRSPRDGHSSRLQYESESCFGDTSPENLDTYLKWPLPNVFLGFSAENQECFDVRWNEMCPLAASGWKVWCSAEPLLGPITMHCMDRLSWVVAGGESGHGARPMNVAWIRSIIQQCKDSGTACFVKQLGANPVRHMNINGALELERFAGTSIDHEYTLKLKDRKGGEMSEWPEDLRVREFPK